jgi:hypothetical protein
MPINKSNGFAFAVLFSLVCWIGVVCLAYQLGKHFG